MKKNSDRTENLKPFKPGQSGNPNGRPKGTLNRSTIFKRWGELEINTVNPITGKKEKLSIDDTLALNLIKAGQEGNVQAIKEYLDCRFGKIKDSIELEQVDIYRELTKEELDKEGIERFGLERWERMGKAMFDE
jgi:hypothetical protein